MVESTVLARIPLDAVCITELRTSWRTQVRCAPEAMKELVQCVSARRWLQAVIVRRLGDSQYELLDGERRLIAARKAGETNIDAVVVEADDGMAAAICLLANMGGMKLRPIEKALACAQVRETLASIGASATQESVGEWVGLKQPTVHQYLQIADGFDAATLSTVGLTLDDLAPYPASLLEKLANLPPDERKAWLVGVRDGVEPTHPQSTSGGSDLIARQVRQLREVCLQQQPGSAPAETAAVLVELLGVVQILAAQATASGLASASGMIQDQLAKASNYRNPIIRVLEWLRLVLSLWRRGREMLRGVAARSAARVRSRVAAYLTHGRRAPPS